MGSNDDDSSYIDLDFEQLTEEGVGIPVWRRDLQTVIEEKMKCI